MPISLGMLCPVPRLRSEGRGFPRRGEGARAPRDDRRRRPGGSFPPHALCSWSCTPQTHGGPMQHPHEVDMVLAVLDTREMVVYGRDLRRPLVADGEDVQTAVAKIPIQRPESAEVLKAYFAAC